MTSGSSPSNTVPFPLPIPLPRGNWASFYSNPPLQAPVTNSSPSSAANVSREYFDHLVRSYEELQHQIAQTNLTVTNPQRRLAMTQDQADANAAGWDEEKQKFKAESVLPSDFNGVSSSNEDLKAQIEKIRSENEDLRKANKTLKSENEVLKNKSRTIKSENEGVKKQDMTLKTEKKPRERENKSLKFSSEDLKKENKKIKISHDNTDFDRHQISAHSARLDSHSTKRDRRLESGHQASASTSTYLPDELEAKDVQENDYDYDDYGW
nr:uncharacterized protein CI109_005752 [Kwoniella shandongensis]KAA5525871.1 hypothetical protein CI109_005752 [Kwoniella shandongensis]